MRFRKATQRDVDSLQLFNSKMPEKTTVFGHTLGREFFKSMVRTGLVYLAEDDSKKTIGCLLANADARIQFSNIIHLAIDPEVAKAEVIDGLMKKHIEECKKMNISDVALHTTELGKKNIDMYSNMGFNPEKKFMMLTRQVEGF